VADITVIVNAPGIPTTWGERTWGDASWGQQTGLVTDTGTATTVANANVNPTGIAAGTSVGQIDIDIGVTVVVSGISATTSIGDESIALGRQQDVTGISLSTSIGSVSIEPTQLIGTGWGRRTWGNLAWGDAFSAQAVGQALSASQGTVTPVTDVSISVSGFDLLTITQGISSLKIDQDITVFASEDQLDTAIGSTSQTGLANVNASGNSASSSVGQVIPEPKIPVDVVGVGMTASLGTISLVQTTNESVTTAGLLTGSLGSITPVSVYSVTGQALASSIGSVAVTGTGNIPLTGIGLTANIGSVNVTSWQEIDPGVNNIWTEVDLAA
tara:strand:+ start:3977 stop:4960 length:984 start_codon:yes stop_codon:yes gene_type:complete